MYCLRYRARILPLAALALGLVGWASIANAQSNIDPTNKHAWGENVGWTNWRDADSTAQGVVVGSTFMGGFIWAENIGWINVGDGSPANGVNYANIDGTDFGVNIDSGGDLRGLAWGENIGWINFDGGAMATPPQPARIECPNPPTEPLSRLTGYVWGENVGWLNLDDTTHYVSVDADTTPIDCDMNHDGLVNGLDVQLFVDFLLLTSTPDWRDVCSGDVEAMPDLTIDLDEVASFVACLLNP